MGNLLDWSNFFFWTLSLCSSQDMNSYLGWTNEDAEVQTDQMTVVSDKGITEPGSLNFLSSHFYYLISAANENDRVQKGPGLWV